MDFNDFGTNIPDTNVHQMALQVPSSLNVCFYTTWENRTNKICIEMNNKRQQTGD